ncbi:hypothetical protein [Streptomyces sp. 891-h]|uniref:hypothetical protein n=1 Tax=Streptomyces sp. 891-h TaxID=2720714 RepID=UPI001FA998A7|nr:hypothetical protein [Streptomyces sp. 891-h]UNZ17591.1 hypothetical protein HC362_11505 [Streptomyces sp. 891-h]
MSPTQTTLVQVLPLAKDLDENKVTPGVLGFIVFAVIGAAVWMLMKSMNKHMKRVDFEERPAEGEPAPGESPDESSAKSAKAAKTAADDSAAEASASAEAAASAPPKRKG